MSKAKETAMADKPITVRVEVEYEDERVRREAVFEAETGERIGTNETTLTADA